MTILLVCTGNTCRSPMAEVMAAAMLGSTGPLSPQSAGIEAEEGAPASPQAVEVLSEIGLDLGGHRARLLTREMMAAAGEILVMTLAQRQRLLELDADAASKISLLDPSGAEVPDPAGGDLEQYRRTGDQLRRALAARFARP